MVIAYVYKYFVIWLSIAYKIEARIEKKKNRILLTESWEISVLDPHGETKK